MRGANEGLFKRFYRKHPIIAKTLVFGVSFIGFAVTAFIVAAATNDYLNAKQQIDKEHSFIDLVGFYANHDNWELKHTDSDGDGISDLKEIKAGTNPYKTPEEEKREIKFKENTEYLSEKIGRDNVDRLIGAKDITPETLTKDFVDSIDEYDNIFVIGSEEYREGEKKILWLAKSRIPESYNYAKENAKIVMEKSESGNSHNDIIYISKPFATFTEGDDELNIRHFCYRNMHLAAHEEYFKMRFKGYKPELLKELRKAFPENPNEYYALEKQTDCLIEGGLLSKEEKESYMQKHLATKWWLH